MILRVVYTLQTFDNQTLMCEKCRVQTKRLKPNIWGGVITVTCLHSFAQYGSMRLPDTAGIACKCVWVRFMPHQSSSFNNVDCSYFSLSALAIVATGFCDDVLAWVLLIKAEVRALFCNDVMKNTCKKHSYALIFKKEGVNLQPIKTKIKESWKSTRIRGAWKIARSLVNS